LWFDETGGGGSYADFSNLATSYNAFMGTPSQTVNFNDLSEGTVLSNQYISTYGVTFGNTANGQYASYSGAHPEGGGIVQDVTGYDGSYMANGDMVYVKFDNDLPNTPLTIDFASPVSEVGAFVGMGIEGNIHTLNIAAYDTSNHLLGSRTVQSWLWEPSSFWQNYESFFGIRSQGGLIGRVEIMNNSTTDFANALILDKVSFRPGGVVSPAPEPGTIMLIAGQALAVALVRRKKRSSITASA